MLGDHGDSHQLDRRLGIEQPLHFEQPDGGVMAAEPRSPGPAELLEMPAVLLPIGDEDLDLPRGPCSVAITDCVTK